jgi:hypothetical protein
VSDLLKLSKNVLSIKQSIQLPCKLVQVLLMVASKESLFQFDLGQGLPSEGSPGKQLSNRVES